MIVALVIPLLVLAQGIVAAWLIGGPKGLAFAVTAFLLATTCGIWFLMHSSAVERRASRVVDEVREREALLTARIEELTSLIARNDIEAQRDAQLNELRKKDGEVTAALESLTADRETLENSINQVAAAGELLRARATRLERATAEVARQEALLASERDSLKAARAHLRELENAVTALEQLYIDARRAYLEGRFPSEETLTTISIAEQARREARVRYGATLPHQ